MDDKNSIHILQTMNSTTKQRTNSKPSAERAAIVGRILQQNPNQMLQAICPKNYVWSTPSKQTQQPKSPTNEDALESYNATVVQAVRTSNLEKLRQLLYRDQQSFEACNNNGEYLIHLACRRGDLDTIRFMVEDAQVNINVRDDMGRTVLHDVCWRPRAELEMWGFLLAHVDPALLLMQDKRGHTPFDYSRTQDWPQWNKYLLKQRHVLLKRLSGSLEVSSSDEEIGTTSSFGSSSVSSWQLQEVSLPS